MTISLEPKLKRELDNFAKQRQLSKSDVVKDALKKYMLRDEFYKIRGRFSAKAKKLGYLTDDDIYQAFN